MYQKVSSVHGSTALTIIQSDFVSRNEFGENHRQKQPVSRLPARAVKKIRRAKRAAFSVKLPGFKP